MDRKAVEVQGGDGARVGAHGRPPVARRGGCGLLDCRHSDIGLLLGYFVASGSTLPGGAEAHGSQDEKIAGLHQAAAG